MKIGVVADTHSKEVPKEVLSAFKEVDFIIHAGDFCTADDLKVFTGINTVKAVYGNMDESALCKNLPERLIFEYEGLKFGVYHGTGPAKRVLEFVQQEFKKDKLDVIVFGHSHCPINQKIGNVLYFNPGSPNDTVVAPYCSYGILEINDKKVTGKIIKLDAK